MKISNINYALINVFLPIIIISFFLLDSLIYNNIKGIVFLIGLSFTIMATIFVGNSFNIRPIVSDNEICKTFTFNNLSNYTKLPINPSILIFTTIYLVYTMLKNNYVLANLNFIIIMLLIIISDNLWLLQNGCYSTSQLVMSNGIGIIMSLLWSYVIHKSNNKSIIYTIGVDSASTCEVPKRKTYKCKYKSKTNK